MKDYKFTDEQIELIGRALGELPFKEVAQLISKIQTQYNEQTKEQKQ